MSATNTTTQPPVTAAPQEAAHLLAQGDLRWAQARPPQWRERELALPWPHDLLVAFSLRMATHGMSLSRSLMLCDRRYALQQLVDAHSLDDEGLRVLAVQLFRHFQARQSRLGSSH
ncbi:MAG: hypothetical protein KGZ67_13220 [Hydrogenophaga sp.]|jgi:hypothetical protein|nr:hypothetical protein [Hydrogenophaga sp.]